MKRSLWLLTFAAALLATGVPSDGAAQKRATQFQVGDRILLHVEGDSALTDTFTAVAGPGLRLPNIGEITLAAAPRPALEPHLAREPRRYINDPVAQARP